VLPLLASVLLLTVSHLVKAFKVYVPNSTHRHTVFACVVLTLMQMTL